MWAVIDWLLRAAFIIVIVGVVAIYIQFAWIIFHPGEEEDDGTNERKD